MSLLEVLGIGALLIVAGTLACGRSQRARGAAERTEQEQGDATVERRRVLFDAALDEFIIEQREHPAAPEDRARVPIPINAAHHASMVGRMLCIGAERTESKEGTVVDREEEDFSRTMDEVLPASGATAHQREAEYAASFAIRSVEEAVAAELALGRLRLHKRVGHAR